VCFVLLCSYHTTGSIAFLFRQQKVKKKASVCQGLLTASQVCVSSGSAPCLCVHIVCVRISLLLELQSARGKSAWPLLSAHHVFYWQDEGWIDFQYAL
jgi:hypothetical protein